MKPRLSDRHVSFEGCFNFRDIGGYRGLEGREVRWGRYFRAGQQDQMTPADLAKVEALGLQTQIDLRQPVEVEQYGPGPLGALGVEREWLPVLPDNGSGRLNERHGPGISGERYVGYLEFHPELWLRGLELIANQTSYPLLVHCRVGKDRTGVLTALTLSILGVDRETIGDDYMLTQEEIARLVAFSERQGLATPGVSRDDMNRVSSVPAGAISLFLETLEGNHGGPLAYLRSIGTSEELFAAIRANLLESSEGG